MKKETNMTRKETTGMKYAPVLILTAIIVAASLVCAFSLSGVKTASAENSPENEAALVVEQQDEATTDGGEVTTNTVEVVEQDGDTEEPLGTTPADDCTVTINYLEYANYDDEPDMELDQGNRRVLGKRVITGLHEGDVLNAWDYAINLPGHFFFDGWPLDLTVTTDPAKNTMDLIYVKLWNSEYTVNYYVMTGADLEADNWHDALAPDDVQFYKMGSETFDNQRFDKLINGDAYEYKLDDMYVIDTYPAQIRLGTDPDNNVINVLYTPESTYLPDDLEVPDEAIPPADDDTGNGGDNSGGDNGEANKPGDSTTLPGDTTLDKDDMIATLPDNIEVGSDEFDDFLGSDTDRGELEVTDEMLANDKVNKEDAEKTIKAYETGLHNGQLASTGEEFPILAAVSGGIALVAIIILISYIVVNRRKMGTTVAATNATTDSDTSK